MNNSWTNINGFHLDCTIYGQSSEFPTVIMDAGYGDYSKAWELIYPEISKLTQVILYDRAGLGKSERSSNPRTSLFMVEELRELLKDKNVLPPYILVGHSYGGVNMRLFNNLYPQEVAGLVLIDSTPEEYPGRFLPTMSEEFKEAYKKQFTREGNLHEFMESLKQLQKSNRVSDTPTIVLSAGKKDHYSKESQALWNRMQEEILRFTSNGQFLIAENSAHYIQKDEPQLVKNIIIRFIESLTNINHSNDRIMINENNLIVVLFESWSMTTSSKWSSENPAKGQCGVTSLVVQDFLGGEIVKTLMPKGWHFYNKVNGIRYDYTSSQFDKGVHYSDTPSNRAEAFQDTNLEQYLTLKKNVLSCVINR
jgi:pimeloyl-ACP methyl ester carboxylesterase